MSETQRDVFEALLSAYCSELDYAATPEGEHPREGEHGGRRAGWLARFDAADMRSLGREVGRWIRQRLATADGWISVEERLPELGAEVLVFSPSTGQHVARYDPEPQYDPDPELGLSPWRSTDTAYPGERASHWMPLPEPPK